jgi:predicted HAD superfamily Cof-like phosphohydrolase
MSQNLNRDVAEFHRKVCEITDLKEPGIPKYERCKLRVLLVLEEALELAEALGFEVYIQAKGTGHQVQVHYANRNPDLVKAADACADLKYVTVGTENELGLADKAQYIWDAVHAANMNKAGGPMRPDGKRQKPEGWTPADVAAIIFRKESSDGF